MALDPPAPEKTGPADQAGPPLVLAPMRGLAAYWLSLKRLIDEKKHVRILEDEAQNAQEPFIAHLLDLAVSDIEAAGMRILCETRMASELDLFSRKLDLMRVAVLDMAAGENPRRTLVKMTAHFAKAPIGEEKAFRLAQDLAGQAAKTLKDKTTPDKTLYDVHYHLLDDRLMTVLLFYVLFARREGKPSLKDFAPLVSAGFFQDGLALVVDNFDVPFVRKRLSVHKRSLVEELARKMRLSIDLCLGLRNRLGYDNLFRIAKSYVI